MRRHSIIACIILISASIIALASAWHDAPIVDEVPHIGAGYSYIAGHTYEFNPEHPPLAKDLAGLALIPLGINSKILSAVYDGNWPTDVHGQWNFGRSLIYHSGVDPITLVHAAKFPLILFFILAGWLVYAWTRKTYNSRAALIAVFLFAFCPTVIAHARFVTTDVPALFGVLFASYFFVRYLERQSTANFWLAAISFGIALLTKFSMFLLVPYFLLLAVVWARTRHGAYLKPAVRLVAKSILAMVVGFVIIIGPVYQLHLLGYPPAQQKADAAAILQSYPIPVLSDTIIWASDKPILRPYAEWGLGLAMVFQRAEGGNRTYFFGELSRKSFKTYFPVVYALKEPIPFLILLASAIWLGWRAWRAERGSLKNKLRDHFPAFAMLLWIFIYVATSINANLNIGVRHLMPIYGFIFVLVAGQIEPLLTKKRLKILIFILLGWYVLEFASVYPYYLTYFNEFAGGPSGGHNYVVDSNLDWGQDLWRLGDYIHENHIQKIYLDYFGWAEQSFYLGNSFQWMNGGQYTSAAQFLRDNPTGGWLGVSATYYQESTVNPNNPYAWLAAYKPAAVIGNSIFVWHIVP
jgi:hypothetical protein